MNHKDVDQESQIIVSNEHQLLGKDVIRFHAGFIPELPGIYKMFNNKNQILYIGKAKNLKNRLQQYILEQNTKNEIMLSQLVVLEYIVTESEAAALIMEAQLVKKYKPKFNILLKDDKSLPYIKLRLDHDYPQLIKIRTSSTQGLDGLVFGPFASSTQLNITLDFIQKTFKLRSCSDNYFSARKRPCLEYEIKRCFGPCVSKIAKEEYDTHVMQIFSFLTGKTLELQKILASQMEKYSENLMFEKAAEIRDKIKAISYVQNNSMYDQKILQDVDIVAIVSTHGIGSNKIGEYCIHLQIYRFGQSCGHTEYFPSCNHETTSQDEVLEAFLMQFYRQKKPPKEILLNAEILNGNLISEALKQIHEIDIAIKTPQIGAKKSLVQLAQTNALLALEKHLKISAKNAAMLHELQRLFKLSLVPKRIEIYDNSHIQGDSAVGAMVVAGANGFEKKEYRIFNIESTKIGDDYAMLKEVMLRRLKKIKSNEVLTEHKPDIIIIDGGAGHMNIVQAVMDELDCHIFFVCMSKGKDRNAGNEYFHIPNNPSFTLDKNQAVMKYLQILRDEAHKFAITNHRKKRSKKITHSSIDSIAGIGAKRKKSLLNHFGSLQSIAAASKKDIAKVEGISVDLASKIYDHLHAGN